MPKKYKSRVTYPRRKNVRAHVSTYDDKGNSERPTEKERSALSAELKKASPVKTGRLRRAWRVTRNTKRLLGSNNVGYAGYVNRQRKNRGFVQRGIKAWAKRVKRTK